MQNIPVWGLLPRVFPKTSSHFPTDIASVLLLYQYLDISLFLSPSQTPSLSQVLLCVDDVNDLGISNAEINELSLNKGFVEEQALSMLKTISGMIMVVATTNKKSLFRSRDWSSTNQRPVYPDSVGLEF